MQIKLKDPTKTSALFKETLEFSYSILEKNLKIKKLAPANIEDLQGQSGYIKKLSEKNKPEIVNTRLRKLFFVRS